jgi:hypothetical protein
MRHSQVIRREMGKNNQIRRLVIGCFDCGDWE